METLSFLNVIYPKFVIFTLIFTRIFTLFYTFSMFRREMATVRILLTLSFILSLYVLALSPGQQLQTEILSLNFFLHQIVQFVIGFSVGLIMNIILDIFSAIGQVISTEIGLSAASLFDPKFGIITSLTHFYVIIGTIIFLNMNGHLMMIETLVKSFQIIPVTLLISQFYGSTIADFSAIIFSGSVIISITIIGAVLMTNLGMAFITKFSPQFNLFSIGLNLTILIGLFCVYISFNALVNHGQEVIQTVLNFYRHYLIGLGSHG